MNRPKLPSHTRPVTSTAKSDADRSTGKPIGKHLADVNALGSPAPPSEDPELERQMRLAREVLREQADVLRELAKR